MLHVVIRLAAGVFRSRSEQRDLPSIWTSEIDAAAMAARVEMLQRFLERLHSER
jgi:hypothetical protein